MAGTHAYTLKISPRLIGALFLAAISLHSRHLILRALPSLLVLSMIVANVLQLA